MDPRLKQLSYSSKLTLQSCPRKFQLTKLGALPSKQEDLNGEITLLFGKLVGLGIQLVFSGHTREQVIWSMFIEWDLPLMVSSTKHKKNFFLAVSAIDRFISMREQGFLANLEILYYNGKPAAELSYSISFNEGFNDRGFLDLVLKNSQTGEIFVMEIKTNSSKVPVNPAAYANSSQALGYSVVLDHMNIECSSYNVIYLIYLTEKLEYVTFPFIKTVLAKAEWLMSTLLDIEAIKSYERVGMYPKHGQSCLAYNRPCKFFDICHMSNDSLLANKSHEEIAEEIAQDAKRYEIHVNYNELINSQLGREEIRNLTEVTNHEILTDIERNHDTN